MGLYVEQKTYYQILLALDIEHECVYIYIWYVFIYICLDLDFNLSNWIICGIYLGYVNLDLGKCLGEVDSVRRIFGIPSGRMMVSTKKPVRCQSFKGGQEKTHTWWLQGSKLAKNWDKKVTSSESGYPENVRCLYSLSCSLQKYGNMSQNLRTLGTLKIAGEIGWFPENTVIIGFDPSWNPIYLAHWGWFPSNFTLRTSFVPRARDSHALLLGARMLGLESQRPWFQGNIIANVANWLRNVAIFCSISKTSKIFLWARNHMAWFVSTSKTSSHPSDPIIPLARRVKLHSFRSTSKKVKNSVHLWVPTKQSP